MEQRTDDWFKARLGHLTASRASDALAKPSTAARRNYQIQLVTERLTGLQSDSFTNSFIQRWGNEGGATWNKLS